MNHIIYYNPDFENVDMGDLFDRSSYQWMGRSIETLIAGFEHVPSILDPTSSLVFEEEAKDTTTTTTTWKRSRARSRTTEHTVQRTEGAGPNISLSLLARELKGQSTRRRTDVVATEQRYYIDCFNCSLFWILHLLYVDYPCCIWWHGFRSSLIPSWWWV